MRTEYSVRALYYLSRLPGGATARRSDIATTQEIPLSFLDQILQDLRKAGLIESVRGPSGGYRLARDGGQINLWDIYLAVESQPNVTALSEESCSPAVRGECSRMADCRIQFAWSKVKSVLRDQMKQISLAGI